PLGAKDPLSEDGFHGAKVAAFPGGLGILLPVRRGLSEARDRLSSAAVKTAHPVGDAPSASAVRYGQDERPPP
ncbi:hypothetical protein, partial [Pseudomonas aeruginosa]|uniref:hypothetical protein n=1 Tax=Pseudomonas aeruginosa TaxID=287 RepID=UPI001BCA08C4